MVTSCFGSPPGMPGKNTPLQQGPPAFVIFALGHCSVLLAQYTPIRAGNRPVSKPARAGEQTGDALYHWVKRRPSRAKPSIAGVVEVGWP